MSKFLILPFWIFAVLVTETSNSTQLLLKHFWAQWSNKTWISHEQHILKVNSTLWASGLSKTVSKHDLRALINSEDVWLRKKICSTKFSHPLLHNQRVLIQQGPALVSQMFLSIACEYLLGQSWWAHQGYKNTAETSEFLQCSSSNQCISRRALSHGNDPFENYYYYLRTIHNFFKRQ